MTECLTKEILHNLADENLDLSASITVALFHDASFFSKARRILTRDLKLFQTEFQRRKEKC